MPIGMIWGANGQDGSYLSELLLAEGYKVYGVVRRSSVDNLWRLDGVMQDSNFTLLEGDITDYFSVMDLTKKVFGGQADRCMECYNLAAQSHVFTSFSQPDWTARTIYSGALNVLESIRQVNPAVRVYQASSSEMWGDNKGQLFVTSPIGELYPEPIWMQNEQTFFSPQSPYAVAKVAAHNLCDMYRKAYGMYISQGILCNHESSRRGERFVTQKIVNYLGELLDSDNVMYELGTQHPIPIRGAIPKLKLGNLDAYRDWGHAKDFVFAMFLILKQRQPSTYVISTGETRTVREFLSAAFQAAGISDWGPYVEIDESLKRPAEVGYLCGHYGKAYRELGWQPTTSFDELVNEMVSEVLEVDVFE